MFWKKEESQSTMQLQEITNASPRSRYEALENIDLHEDKTVPEVTSGPINHIENIDPCDIAQKRFFGNDNIVSSKARTVTITGMKADAKRFRPIPGMVAHLPEKCSSFKLVANLSHYSAGLYSIRWRVKALPEFCIPNGLHFAVNVSYEVEPDISGTIDVVMKPEQLNHLVKDQWYNLELEEKLIIQPHEGIAKVQLVLCNNENERYNASDSPTDYTGLAIEHVEIRPITAVVDIHSDIADVIVPRAATPKFIIDATQSHLMPPGSACSSSPATITKVASSKSGRFIASLALSRNTAHLTVWDITIARYLSSPATKGPDSNKAYATAVVEHPGIGNLAIGLSLSSTGDQVAIYQEPKIGQWSDGSTAEKASFPFRLFNNPLVPQPTVVLSMEGNEVAGCQPQSLSTTDSPLESVGVALLQEVGLDIALLSEFVGYGSFLPETKKDEWEKNDINSAWFTGVEGEEGENAESGDGEEQVPTSSSMFVACNGLYLDVFEISSEKTWKRLHTITLAELVPTLSRRITCKMMMETITSNTFMWLEDGGLCCTIWNLQTGSNISFISSLENSRFKGPTFRGHCKMAISPHESIVALASVDGTVTTYFANTGMAIDKRKFPGFKVEYLGFHAQDDQLFIILRNSATFQLSARILDSLQLKYEVSAHDVPIPTVGSTILAFFQAKGFWHRGFIFEADGGNINCYISHQPTSSKVNKDNEKVVTAAPGDEVNTLAPVDNIRYELKVGVHRESLPEGDGASYWVLRAEVIEHDLKLGTQRIVFSFVPEPWMRATTTEVVEPANLLKAYFIPGGTRFALVGKQTLQIWNLPKTGNSKCTLQFIWSQPVDEKELLPGGVAHKSKYLHKYYYDLSSVTVYLDTTNGNTAADIKAGPYKRKMISLTGEGNDGARHAILHCFRSIHLLAEAYAYSYAENKKTIRDVQSESFTFEDHAEAILRFTREHINRMMSKGLCYPSALSSGNTAAQQSKTDSGAPTKHSKANSATQPGVVTILTLLMDHPHLQCTNHVFVEALLNSSNGEWVPRDNKALNPIMRAIEARNGSLVEVFIDYCIKNAKSHDPAYLIPAIQCLNELKGRYPNILADMFRKASYVPAHNHRYVSSHAIVSNRTYGDWINFLVNYYSFRLLRGTWVGKSHNINDYEQPVFSLRSQLPFRATTRLNILSIERSVLDTRDNQFPAKRDEAVEEQKNQAKFSHKIFVCPFPKLSKFPAYRGWLDDETPTAKSAFTDIAGQELFDSPAMAATLAFKWNKYGCFNWFLRFLIALVFFICVTVITAEQIRVTTIPEAGPPSAGDIADRYLEGWRPFIKFTIFVGFLQIIYDLQRFMDSPKKYIRSPYNYMHMVAHVLPIAGCFIFLGERPHPDTPPPNQDYGPSQIPVMSFAILALYTNMLFELRVVRQLGIVVNIILNITRRIRWFFLIFAIFLVSFTHALMHLLHTRSYKDCTAPNANCGDYPDGYPTTFLTALTATYFFLAGRYDPVATSFDKGSASFHIMMVIFFFFTTVLLLNILIALMNDAFNESKEQGQMAWLKQWSAVIADAELSYLSDGSRQNRNYFPDYIYYGANEKEAELYESQYYITSKSTLSIENRFVVDTVSVEQNATQLTQRVILRDVKDLNKNQEDLNKDIVEIKNQMQQTQDKLAQELMEVKQLMVALLAQTGGIADPRSERAQHHHVSYETLESSSRSHSPRLSPPPAAQADVPLIGESLPSQEQESGTYIHSAEPAANLSKSERLLRTQTSQSRLKAQIQHKLAVVHTLDEVLKSQHQGVDDNNASHPVYVDPQTRRVDEETPLKHVMENHSTFLGRTQSEHVVPTAPHESVPLHVHPPRGARPQE